MNTEPRPDTGAIADRIALLLDHATEAYRDGRPHDALLFMMEADAVAQRLKRRDAK